jgi:beta-glucuronidase
MAGKCVYGLGLAVLLSAIAPAAAEVLPPAPKPLLVDADSRPGLDLSGTWHYSIDPYRDGLTGFHGGSAGPGHRRYDDLDVGTTMRREPSALFEYDMRRSPTAQVPGSWVGYEPALRYYDGLVWYQKIFAAKRPSGQRAFLRFGAADYASRVYLNGTFIGGHEGGFTPFAFEVTGLLRNGNNQLTVAVDSTRTPDSIPPPVTDWDNYGGITRPVRLIRTPDTYVDDFWIRLKKDGQIAVTVQLDGPHAGGAAVVVRIAALALSIAGKTDAAGMWTASVLAPPSLKRWAPEAPTLYDVEVDAGEDALHDRVGFRTIEVHGRDILLNGRPIFLRGISLHGEEFGEKPSRRLTPEAVRALLVTAKALNANFVRLAHYPHSEIATRMADEMGLLVWSEIPVYWLVKFDNPQTLSLARRMLAENILRDRNRASVIVWSVGNETPPGDARNAFLARLADDARTLDDTRLVSAAVLANRQVRAGHTLMTIDDPLIAHLDVMAANTYDGWYSSDPLASLPSIEWRSEYDKPLILSEFGAGALAGFHDPAGMHKFSEEFQAEYYRQTLAMADKIPFLRGMSPWILKDFRSPRRQHPVYQNGWNRKGLVSETGRRKLAFAVLAEYYRRRAGAKRGE